MLFTHLPMPPTSNNQYYIKRIGKRTIHVPSSELTLFRKEMTRYSFANAQKVEASRELVGEWFKSCLPLEIDCVFFFHRKRLISKQNKFKKLDVSNRIKAAHDAIADMLRIDDSHFFRIIAEKSICPEGIPEHFSFDIHPIEKEEVI